MIELQQPCQMQRNKYALTGFDRIALQFVNQKLRLTPRGIVIKAWPIASGVNAPSPLARAERSEAWTGPCRKHWKETSVKGNCGGCFSSPKTSSTTELAFYPSASLKIVDIVDMHVHQL